MLETQNKESNYLCKVVALKGLRKHINADRLQCVNVGMNNVITGLDAKEGDIYVYFPIESKINADFLSFTNSFRDNTKNADMNKEGFFEDNCRVRAMKLRGEKSMGYLVPYITVAEWSYGTTLVDPKEVINTEFDTIGGKLLVEKYEVKKRVSNNTSSGKKPRVSRLIDGQINLHGKTKNLRHYPEAINPNDIISISYKTHGTSWWVANVLTKRKLTWLEKIAKRFGVTVKESDYDVMYGSRNVVKNESYRDPKQADHFYGVNVWSEIADEVGALVPKGFTLYGEALGFTSTGEYIQKGFDYGCDPKGENGKPRMKLEVYRITQTNPDGVVTELTFPEMEEFCMNVGLNTPKLFFYGKAGDFYYKDYTKVEVGNLFGYRLTKLLEAAYNEKDCFMCDNKVPEEGIVIRKERLIGFDGYKLKSFRFLEKETKQLDKGESDIESEN